MHNYTAFGLMIQSELPFRELLSVPRPVNNKYDITIKLGSVDPVGLNGTPSPQGVFYQVTSSKLWLHVPNVARFRVTNGHQIIIEPLAETNEDSIRLFALGSCMGALLMQRNLFLLHGNAISINDGHCVSFIGDSGVGKSTLSGAFFRRSYSILADDICAINTEARVMPSFPQIKLCADAAQQLQIDARSLNRIMPSLNKFAVSLGDQFYPIASKLKMVYVLDTHHQDSITITPLVGTEKLDALQQNIYRKQYLNERESVYACLKQCMQIASQIDIARITRPINGFKLNELVDAIESDLSKRGFMTKPVSSQQKETL